MPTDRAFETTLRGLSRDDLVGLVAALYAARGAEVAVDDDVVTVDGERLLVAPRGHAGRLSGRISARFDGRTVDAVVARSRSRAERLAADRGARAVGPTDLWRLARYGLASSAADAVFETHLGRPLDEFEPPTRPARGTSGRGDSPGRLVSAVVVALALLVVLSTLGPWLPALVDGVPGSASGSPAGSEASSTAAGDGAVTTDADAAAARRAGGDVGGGPRADGGDSGSQSLAPGLTVDGLVGAERLAKAHARALGNQSYRWELRYTESTDGTVTARGRETVRVARPDVFRSDVNWTGSNLAAGPVAARPSFADGETLYRPSVDGDAVVSRPLETYGPGGRQGLRATRLLEWALSTDESSVVRTRLDVDPRRYVVNADGATVQGVRNYTATAHVTPAGLVTYLAVSYCLGRGGANTTGSAVCAEFVVQYVLEDVEVTPPPWYVGTVEARRGVARSALERAGASSHST